VQTPEDQFDEATNKVHFRYAITEFGRQRMADTGLLDLESKETTQ
jgi:ribosome biogenesis SPOUT family RNA methylase Rps3